MGRVCWKVAKEGFPVTKPRPCKPVEKNCRVSSHSWVELMTSGPPPGPEEFERGFGRWRGRWWKNVRIGSVKRPFVHNDDALFKQDDREPELLPPRLDGLDREHPSGTTTLGDRGHAAEAPERQ